MDNLNNLGIEFCKYYYDVYDNNFYNLASLYKADSKFTYLDKKILGFNNLHDYIVNGCHIKHFRHKIKNCDVQPLGKNTMLILITGQIKGYKNKNDNPKPHNFIETMVIQRKNTNSNFFIQNTIFKFM